ncbi:CSON014786, partial [Symbiodinium microadriaticum]
VRPIYIREAYRLLQQSIIFVEMEDIELDADEEVQDDSESVDGGDMEALDTAGDSSVSNMTTHVTERLSEVENASTANEESKRSRDPLSGDNEALRDAGDVEQSVKRARRDKSGKSKTMMSAELYRSMTAMIGLILKTKEEQHVLSGEDGDFDGCRWGDVVSWYLEQ